MFGQAWSSNLDVCLQIDSQTSLPGVREEDGRTTRYDAAGAGRYAPIIGSLLPHALTKEADGRFTRRWDDGFSETFDAKDRKTAGAGAYVMIRDVTCRLFGYHGLINDGQAFSLDHMFGF